MVIYFRSFTQVMALIGVLVSFGCERVNRSNHGQIQPSQVPIQPLRILGQTFNERYRETAEQRGLVEEAITFTNLIMADDVPFQLVPIWKSTVNPSKEQVPIYLGCRKTKGISSIAFVPLGERCIIVEEDELHSLEEMLGNDGNVAVKQSPLLLLVIVLLHESGHLVLGHSGCFDENGDQYVQRIRRNHQLDADEANRPTESKAQETAADQFVVERLKAALADTSNVSRNVKAMMLGSTLPLASLNICSKRILSTPVLAS